MAYLTPREEDYVNGKISHRGYLPHSNAPHVIKNITNSQFSSARQFGGMILNKYTYIYLGEHDEMIRKDVYDVTERRRKYFKAKQDRERQIYLAKMEQQIKDNK